MLAHTHSTISKVIVENLKKDNGIYLSSKHFSWGSVKPDLVLPPFRPKHYMDETLDDIVEQIFNLIEAKEVSTKKISLQIGAITHFITDFFTLPHSERWEWVKSGRTIEHIVYEKNLKSIAKNNAGLINPIALEMKQDWTREELKKWIVYQHEQYKKKVGFEQDLFFASSLSQSITQWIVLQRIQKEIA